MANCYMGVRGTVRPTVTCEGEVKLTDCYIRARGEVQLTVTWLGEVPCNQLLHGRERYSAANCYMGGRA